MTIEKNTESNLNKGSDKLSAFPTETDDVQSRSVVSGKTIKSREEREKSSQNIREKLHKSLIDSSEKLKVALKDNRKEKRLSALQSFRRSSLGELDLINKLEESHKRKHSESPEDPNSHKRLSSDLAEFNRIADSINNTVETVDKICFEMRNDQDNMETDSNPPSVPSKPAISNDNKHCLPNFGLVGTNNRVPVNIDELYQAYRGPLSKLSQKVVDNMINGGKTLGGEIKTAREAGKIYVVVMGDFILNVNKKTEYIERTDLTKSRFYALLHKRNHSKSTVSEDHVPVLSPLIHKVVMNAANPLYVYINLLGSGFQYQWRSFIEGAGTDKENYSGLSKFFAGCLLLDYLSEQNVLAEGTERMTFPEYIRTAESNDGTTVQAAIRNMGEWWDKFDSNEEHFSNAFEVCNMITFDWAASTVKKSAESFHMKMRAAANRSN